MKTIRGLASLFAVVTFGALVGCGTVASPKGATTAAPVAVAAKPKPKPTVAEIRAQLAAHRKLQLERLAAYSAGGEFPRNLTSPTPTHQFKDDDGRLCAVANLVHQDGHDDLVDATAKYHNDVVLADVKDGPLMDWVLASGLTLEEVASIQEPGSMVYVGESPLDPASPQVIAPAPITVAQMQAQMRAHFLEVALQITANTEASLDVAVARFEASPIASDPIAMGSASEPSAIDD